jgi:hypothetical protein
MHSSCARHLLYAQIILIFVQVKRKCTDFVHIIKVWQGREKEKAVLKGYLDTFHYSRTFFGFRVFSDEIRKSIEKTILERQPL